MGRFLSFMVVVCVIFTEYSIAADRVVVIPLNSGKPSYGGVQVVTSITGRVWMDRNLGALRAAIHQTDPDAYGALFQWGRRNDGHAWRTSLTTSTLSTNDTPGGTFITTSTPPNDWRISPNNTLWQGASGTNNPCPSGFRLPTASEWETELLSWESVIHAGFHSPLKLTYAGSRNAGGTLDTTGWSGNYWSSSIDNSGDIVYAPASKKLSLNDLWPNRIDTSVRSHGYSVRCIKD